ncbi:MAG: hypothetical protein V1755_06550 [Chloroflexota bacterium]
MPTILDYAESILSLEKQAIEQTERGNREGLRAAAQSLRDLITDCEKALRVCDDLADEDRAWLEAKRDKAAAAMV